jgi:hypothetical protein
MLAQQVSQTRLVIGFPSGCVPRMAETVRSTVGGLGHPSRPWRQKDAQQVQRSLVDAGTMETSKPSQANLRMNETEHPNGRRSK